MQVPRKVSRKVSGSAISPPDSHCPRLARGRHGLGRLLFAGLLWLAQAAWGQQYAIHTYGLIDGLSSPYLTALGEAPDGRLWAGTRVGLCRFDGVEWQMVSPSPQSISSLYWPSGGAYLPDDRPWALSDQRRLSLEEPIEDGWRRYTYSGGPRTAYLAMAWLEGQRGQPRVVLGTREELLTFQDGAWQQHSPAAVGLPAGDVVRALSHQEGGWWIGTDTALFRTRDPWPWQATDVEAVGGVPPGPIYALAPDGEGGHWVVGEGWVGHLRAGGFERLEPPVPPLGRPSERVLARADGLGGLYYGDATRLWRFQPGEGAERLTRISGLAAEGTSALHRDHQGTFWVASDNGLSRIVSLRFASLRQEHGLQANEVTAILRRRDGTMVIGHPHGLSLGRPGTWRTLTIPVGDVNQRLWDLEEDAAGRVWIAAESDGLLVLSPEGELRTVLSPGQLGGGPQTLLDDGEGGILVGTLDGGLHRVEAGRAQRIPLPLGPEQQDVRRLRRTQDGRGVWIGTGRSGLLRWHGGRFDSFVCGDETQRCNWIWDVLERPSGEVWVASLGGLQRIEGDSLVPLEREGLELEGAPFFLEEDAAGQVWIGTDRGVVRFDGRQQHLYSVLEGLAGQEVNRSAFHADPAGPVWVGTDRGLSIYRPWLDGALSPPRVELSALEAEGRTFDPGEEVVLRRPPDMVLLRFFALAASYRGALVVRTRLEGLEPAWSEPYTLRTREIRYGNLPPGTYRFHLQARELVGDWAPPVVSAPIRVPQVLWKRPWFLTLAALVGLGLLWAGERSLAQRRHARRLEGELERRWAELEASQQRYRKAVAHIADGVITTDGEQKVVMMNPAAERWTGYREAEAVGRPVFEVLDLKALGATGRMASLQETIAAPLRQAEAITLSEVRFRDRQGRERVLELVISPMTGAEGAAPTGSRGNGGAVLAFQDVTERRQQEEQQARIERLEAVGLLAGGIAHDFNNLLTIILGNLELLRLGARPEELPLVEEAERAVRRSRDLTQQLLTFSRGGSPIRRAASIAEVAEEAARLTLSGSPVRADLDFPADLPPVDIDAGQFHQVFTNLFINAIEAQPAGGSVRVGAAEGPAPPGLTAERCVVVTVRDDGPGIDPELRDRIFDPYVSTKARGSGLGLSTAFSIVRRHDGLLILDDEPGPGAAFRIYLPVSSEPLEARGAATTLASPGMSGRILVMDDEAAVLRVTRSILERYGFEVVTAQDGAQAITRYRQAREAGRPFRCVVMDLTVPGGMGGREAFERLRQLDPGVRGIVASGYANDPVMAHYREHGFAAVLTKPFLAGDLLRTLREVLESGPESSSGPHEAG